MTTLKERYEQRQHVLTEGFLDYFKSNSQNIQKFNETLASLRKLSQTYNLKNLDGALQKADNDFQNLVIAQQSGQKTDQTKSALISQAVTFVSMMSTFMETLKNITSQLPSMQKALKSPNSASSQLSQLLGNDVNKLGQLISTQFNKSGGGIIAKIGRFFQGGGTQNPQAVLQKYGINGNSITQDILAMTPQQFQKFTEESATTPSFQIQAPPNSNTSQQTAQPTVSTQQTQATQQSQPSQPTQGTVQTSANQKPNAQQAQKRDNAIQNAVKNRNAFNSQVLSQLDNATIEQDIKNLAKALGITL